MTAEHRVGYANPPQATRFSKGQSGNPRGRPRNRHRGIPHDAILGQMVTIRENGRERRVTAAEAFLLQLTQKGLAGDSAAARASLEAIEKARSSRSDQEQTINAIILKPIASGMDAIIDTLGIAVLKYPKDEGRVRWELNPWIVEAALARRAGEPLSASQQREVWENTRAPQKVTWPQWWSYFG